MNERGGITTSPIEIRRTTNKYVNNFDNKLDNLDEINSQKDTNCQTDRRNRMYDIMNNEF